MKDINDLDIQKKIIELAIRVAELEQEQVVQVDFEFKIQITTFIKLKWKTEDFVNVDISDIEDYDLNRAVKCMLRQQQKYKKAVEKFQGKIDDLIEEAKEFAQLNNIDSDKFWNLIVSKSEERNI